jgi:DNA-damage-inducible protein D
MENSLIPFEGKKIRKTWYNEELYFSIVDVIEVLTDSPQPTSYWNKVKKQIEKESELLPFWQKMKFLAPDGKMRPTDCANSQGVLRVIMSVSSPKAEPLKQWMAQVSTERIQETENPELLTQRQIELYKAKGYTDEWITNRLETISSRNKLTDEWKKRNVKEGQEYSILTAIIAKGTFGLNPTEHKSLKGLSKPSENLRDHMSELELIFTALGEVSTRMTAKEKDAQGFDENKSAAIEGGTAAGKALKIYEKQSNRKVVTKDNFLEQIENAEKPKAIPKNPNSTD